MKEILNEIFKVSNNGMGINFTIAELKNIYQNSSASLPDPIPLVSRLTATAIPMNEYTPTFVSNEEVIEREKESYELKKEWYLSNYEGKFIAQFDGEFIDADNDFSTLAKRIFSQYGYKPIFIKHVTRQTRPIRIAPQINIRPCQ